jgi:hypothetical protein
MIRRNSLATASAAVALVLFLPGSLAVADPIIIDPTARDFGRNASADTSRPATTVRLNNFNRVAAATETVALASTSAAPAAATTATATTSTPTLVQQLTSYLESSRWAEQQWPNETYHRYRTDELEEDLARAIAAEAAGSPMPPILKEDGTIAPVRVTRRGEPDPADTPDGAPPSGGGGSTGGDGDSGDGGDGDSGDGGDGDSGDGGDGDSGDGGDGDGGSDGDSGGDGDGGNDGGGGDSPDGEAGD